MLLLKSATGAAGGGWVSDGVASAQMPTGPLRIALTPLTKRLDASTAALKNAATTHAHLAHAVLTLFHHSQPGITLTFRGAALQSDQLVHPGNSSTEAESIQLTILGLAITDIGSGETATSSP